MATSSDLMGVGVPAEMAIRTGYQPVSVTTAATTQGSTGGVLIGPGNKIVSATIHSSGGAVTLPSASAIGDEIIVSNVSGTAGAVFPPSGDDISGETADEGVALGAQGSAASIIRLVKLSASRWGAWNNIAAD